MLKSRRFALGLAVSIAAFGCHRQVAQAAGGSASTPPAGIPAAPAPFASPPILPGTPDVASLVAKVKPAVVNITTTQDVPAPRGFELPFGMDPFGGGGRRGSGESVMKKRALGTGFIVDPRGYVITNAHVVEGADAVRVRLWDDREVDAKVKGRDTKLDLAVLEIQGVKDLPAASLGGSEGLRVGEYVIAIGNPFGLGHTVTMGIVSAKDRQIGAGPYDDFIQTDASINPGNSGGPLFDLHGQVIGINTAINPQGRGIGFAIPVDALKDVLPQLLATGRVSRGKLGVTIQPVDATMAKALGLEKARGALVGDVEANGPAARAGLAPGDVILSVGGAEVPRSEDLPRMVARNAPGAKLAVEVQRDRERRKIDVTLDELRDPGERFQPASASGDRSPAGLGLEVRDVPGRGVGVVGVDPSGAAAEALERGDVIVEVNRKPVTSVAELQQRLDAAPAGGPLLLRVQREGKSRYVAIERR